MPVYLMCRGESCNNYATHQDVEQDGHCVACRNKGKRASAALQVPTEAQECTALAQWLNRAGVLYTHVPMGGLRDRKAAALLRNMGTKAGVPDYLIFSLPPAYWMLRNVAGRDVHGVALEMKRRKGGTLTEPQKWWIAQLKLAGWHVIVARGAEDAVTQLTALGYGQQTDHEVAR